MCEKLLKSKMLEIDEEEIFSRKGHRTKGYENVFHGKTHHLIKNKLDDLGSLYLNDEIFGPLRPEPR